MSEDEFIEKTTTIISTHIIIRDPDNNTILLNKRGEQKILTQKDNED